ncbi:MAG: glycerol kinase GlpK, partial [Erysipelotrichaceae bacterium]|nr:glycerol kinase GlpK [Erysipelotrichaceae bacterium]
MKKYIMAIDQGTTSTRAILFDQDQKPVKTAQKEIRNFFPQPGWVEQDANEIWLSTLSVMAELFSDGNYHPEEVAAIGISNQRETSVIWNKKTGLPVYHAIVWQSRQTDKIIERYRKAGVEERVREKTGLVLDPYFSASKINWIMENVEGVRDSDDLLFGTIDTYLLWKMTNGKVHATDVTNASRTLLFNIHTLQWDDELCEIFHVKKSLLPEIKDTSGVFGMIDPAHFFGCSVPITALVGDQQAALFGQSCFKRNDIKNTYGTGGFMLVNTGEEVIISKSGLLSTVAWKIGDEVKYALEGSIFVSGSLIQWLRDGLHFFGNAAETEAIARSVPDSNGVVIVPAFVGLGAPYWNDECRGAIFGLTRGTTVAHMVRASLEAMAYQSKDLVTTIEKELGSPIERLKVDGGASENRFLLQFQSDILSIPVAKSRNKETTALGAARLAGLAVDYYHYSDFEKEDNDIIDPEMPEEEVKKLYERWHKAVKSC